MNPFLHLGCLIDVPDKIYLSQSGKTDKFYEFIY